MSIQKADGYCTYRWMASRVEVPDSVPVEHVCNRKAYHELPHFCVCGANTPFHFETIA